MPNTPRVPECRPAATKWVSQESWTNEAEEEAAMPTPPLTFAALHRQLQTWHCQAASRPRTVTHGFYMTIGTMRKLWPWARIIRNRLTGRTVYAAGMLYFTFAASNPFERVTK